MSRVEEINEKLKQVLIENYRGLQEDVLALAEIKVEFCRGADSDHYKDQRIYAHTRHIEDTICVSSSIKLLDDENIYGILAHEYGHVIHEQFPDLIYGAEEYPGEFELEIDLEYGVQFVEGVQVDPEIFADWIMQKLFDLRIWYDTNKVQWLHV